MDAYEKVNMACRVSVIKETQDVSLMICECSNTFQVQGLVIAKIKYNVGK